MYKKIIITFLLTIGIFLTFDKVSAEEISEACIIDDTTYNSCVTVSMIKQ